MAEFNLREAVKNHHDFDAKTWLYGNFEKNKIYEIFIENFPQHQLVTHANNPTVYYQFKGRIKIGSKLIKYEELEIGKKSFDMAFQKCEKMGTLVLDSNCRIVLQRYGNGNNGTKLRITEMSSQDTSGDDS